MVLGCILCNQPLVTEIQARLVPKSPIIYSKLPRPKKVVPGEENEEPEPSGSAAVAEALGFPKGTKTKLVRHPFIPFELTSHSKDAFIRDGVNYAQRGPVPASLKASNDVYKPGDYDVMTAKCGHMFHRICLKNYIATRPGNVPGGTIGECPFCQRMINLQYCIKTELLVPKEHYRLEDLETLLIENDLLHQQIYNLRGEIKDKEEETEQLKKEVEALEKANARRKKKLERQNIYDLVGLDILEKRKSFLDLKAKLVQTKQTNDMLINENNKFMDMIRNAVKIQERVKKEEALKAEERAKEEEALKAQEKAKEEESLKVQEETKKQPLNAQQETKQKPVNVTLSSKGSSKGRKDKSPFSAERLLAEISTLVIHEQKVSSTAKSDSSSSSGPPESPVDSTTHVLFTRKGGFVESSQSETCPQSKLSKTHVLFARKKRDRRMQRGVGTKFYLPTIQEEDSDDEPLFDSDSFSEHNFGSSTQTVSKHMYNYNEMIFQQSVSKKTTRQKQVNKRSKDRERSAVELDTRNRERSAVELDTRNNNMVTGQQPTNTYTAADYADLEKCLDEHFERSESTDRSQDVARSTGMNVVVKNAVPEGATALDKPLKYSEYDYEYIYGDVEEGFSEPEDDWDHGYGGWR